jgi:BirA family biotin operon repressor/biotin-[acetyl-CoA-carboxylase] ligase
VLTELGLTPDGALDYVVVGIGLNVNLNLADLPEVLTPPTSLLAECGQPVSRLDLLARLLLETEALYLRLCGGWSPHEEWRAALATIGQQVQVGTTEAVIVGTAMDVTDTGALVVEEQSGARHVVLAGDVTLRGHRLGQ